MSKLVLAFLLGVLCTVGVERWIALERTSYMHELRISYIEGFLSQATGGRR